MSVGRHGDKAFTAACTQTAHTDTSPQCRDRQPPDHDDHPTRTEAP